MRTERLQMQCNTKWSQISVVRFDLIKKIEVLAAGDRGRFYFHWDNRSINSQDYCDLQQEHSVENHSRRFETEVKKIYLVSCDIWYLTCQNFSPCTDTK